MVYQKILTIKWRHNLHKRKFKVRDRVPNQCKIARAAITVKTNKRQFAFNKLSITSQRQGTIYPLQE